MNRDVYKATMHTHYKYKYECCMAYLHYGAYCIRCNRFSIYTCSSQDCQLSCCWKGRFWCFGIAEVNI